MPKCGAALRYGGNELAVENVGFTSCEEDWEDGFRSTRFRIFLTDSGAECNFLSLLHICGFYNIRVEVDLDGSSLSIREYAEYNGEDVADCYCQLDASFFIKNLEAGDYSLFIYDSKSLNAPPFYTGTLNLTQGEELAFIVKEQEGDLDLAENDRLTDSGNVYYSAVRQSLVFEEALQGKVQRVEILDTQGKLVLHTGRLSRDRISVETLSKGIYLYRVVMRGNKVLTGKFVK